MNRITLQPEALFHNLNTIDSWVRGHGATWTLTTKALCGFEEAIRTIHRAGIRSMADSRLENLEIINRIDPSLETWYLRPPNPSAVDEIVRLADVSLNSETSIIRDLDKEVRRIDRVHRIVVMIELGDLREGILPGSLVRFYEEIFGLPNVEVVGIGANLGCLSGTVPSVDQVMQLVLYRELLELKFGRRLPVISAGASALLPLLLEGDLPRPVNHFRIGESIFLGTNLVQGGVLPGLRDDAFIVEAEIVELKEKSLVPLGETTDLAPFDPPDEEQETEPGQRGYRAIVSMGQLDTEISGLTPIDPDVQIAGASSDLTVVNLQAGPKALKVGDTVRFKPNYAAMVRMLASMYCERRVDSSRSAMPAAPPQANRLLGETAGDVDARPKPVTVLPVEGRGAPTASRPRPKGVLS